MPPYNPPLIVAQGGFFYLYIYTHRRIVGSDKRANKSSLARNSNINPCFLSLQPAMMMMTSIVIAKGFCCPSET